MISVRNPSDTAAYIAASRRTTVILLQLDDPQDESMHHALRACLPVPLVDTALTYGSAYGVLPTHHDTTELLNDFTAHIPDHLQHIIGLTLTLFFGADYDRRQPDLLPSILVFKPNDDAPDIQRFTTLSALNDIIA